MASGGGYIKKVERESCLLCVESIADERGVNAVKRLAVSTGQLRLLPALHLRPIDLVVFQEPMSYDGSLDLGGGFTPRCPQRLSGPYLAIQRCSSGNAWRTGVVSPPVLSYYADLSA